MIIKMPDIYNMNITFEVYIVIKKEKNCHFNLEYQSRWTFRLIFYQESVLIFQETNTHTTYTYNHFLKT